MTGNRGRTRVVALTRARPRRWLGLLAFVFALASIAGVVAASETGRDAQSRILLEVAVPLDGKPTTLKETLTTAEPLIASWGEGWKLLDVRSTDVDDAPGTGSGLDGRRFSWTVRVAGAGGEERWIRVTGGRATGAIVASSGGNPASAIGFLPGLPAIDSDVAVSTALRRVPGMMGQQGSKVTGIHFSYEVDPQTSTGALAVVGMLGPGVVRVQIDPESGRPLAAERLVFGAGLQASYDAGRTWAVVRDLDGTPLALAADSGGGAFAAVLRGSTLAIVARQFPGWRDVAVLPGEAGAWIRDMAYSPTPPGGELAVAAENGLWLLDVETGALRKDEIGLVTKLESAPDGALHAIRVTVPGASEHVVRDAQGRWTLRADALEPDRLFAVGSEVNASGSDSGHGRFGVPGLLAAAGSDNVMLASSGAGMLRSLDAGSTWRPADFAGKASVIEILVSAGWEQSGVALAREYRGAIWRTGNSGETWEPVLRDVGQMAGMVFAGPGTVFAIVGGIQTWQPL